MQKNRLITTHPPPVFVPTTDGDEDDDVRFCESYDGNPYRIPHAGIVDGVFKR